MEFLAATWLPILLAAILVFIVSSIIHMVLPYHKSDFQEIPAEEEVMAALRPHNIPPGDYFFPRMKSSADMRSEEYKQKIDQGPVAMVTVIQNGMPSMATNLSQWFGYCLLVGFFTAYIGYAALGSTENYLSVFQITGAAAFVGYTLALIQNSIWYHKKWSSTFKSVFDGLIYALLTAGVFGWLWP